MLNEKIIETEKEDLYVNQNYRHEMIYFLEREELINVALHDINFSQNPKGIVYVGGKT